MSGDEALHRGEGWSVRLATRADNDTLCALLREVPLPGPVALAQERDPDFFRLEDAHRPGLVETVVAHSEADGRLVGCGTYVVRDAWMPEGARGRVGYVCDLRVRPGWRGARVLPAMGRAALERARDVHGVHVLHAALAETNRRVVAAVQRGRPERLPMPVARRMTPYDMAAVQPMGRRAPRPPAGVEVATGTRADVEEVAAFLARGQRGRTFGYVVDRKLLETRFQHWPGFGPESFLLLRDRSGRLVGCAAPWDPSPFRRTRVVAYSPAMRAYRALHAGLARLWGEAPLPAPGGCFRYAFLTHCEVEGDEPALLEALVGAALERLRGSGLHFLGVMAPRGSPLQRALRGPWVHRTRLCLHSLALPDGPFAATDFSTARPGFELALA